ncbi:hypothetical protein CDV36_014833 [Fusarium kuroshium]|uniref:Uncharacterized protein n=1 Tax=Fusarium kuroshium TaxID=2010991 RepID=A0A3M2REH8_9HYPO|nr:hypothetical protein CDV36_014833 [Fusarium kuroshium]
MSSLFISIDGGCRGKSTRVAWAVYYGPRSRNNSSGLVPEGLPQTSLFAEIQALKYALISIRNILSNGNTYSNICIKTSSEYLSMMMKGDLRACVQNGWRNEDGSYLRYAESWEWINKLICELEYVHGWQTNFYTDIITPMSNKGATVLVYRTIDAHDLAEKTQYDAN